MDVSNLLARDGPAYGDSAEARRQSHQYPTRHALTGQGPENVTNGPAIIMGSPQKVWVTATSGAASSPRSKAQKHVSFELLLPMPQHRARLPMRVMISPHDSTESIITTVKNFYGLYEGPGVSFQDRQGHILIAAYDNFENNMTVYVRVTPEDPTSIVQTNEKPAPVTMSPRKPKLGVPFEMRPPSHPAQPALGRSPSPRSHRSNSAAPGMRPRQRSFKSQEANMYGDTNTDGYSSSDGGNGSVTSSRRSKTEAHVSAEISVENIVEGGRRKRAKFESSELPLFVPPQVPVPASISSVSPQRRITNENVNTPLPFSNQRTFVYPQAVPSPQSYGRADGQNVQNGQTGSVWNQGLPYSNGHQLRARGPITYQPPRQSTGGILPTPEPTVGSVISDEDVALQLMRLGDVSNFSHGRTSTSTVDDALSGKAEAASSGEESDDEQEPDLPDARRSVKGDHHAGPRRKKQKRVNDNLPSDSMQSSGDEYEDGRDASFKGESDEIMPDLGGATVPRKMSKSKSLGSLKARGSISSAGGSGKSGKNRVQGMSSSKKVNGSSKVPMSPASLPSQSRKASMSSTINFQNHPGPDEDDLSSKPRCQRCRKSKKGCDRQRPCGRCKDAGIGADGCVSEDEGNGRRGRYGRHMGVSIKKDGTENEDDGEDMSTPSVASHGQFLAPALPVDKSKKRKR